MRLRSKVVPAGHYYIGALCYLLLRGGRARPDGGASLILRSRPGAVWVDSDGGRYPLPTGRLAVVPWLVADTPHEALPSPQDHSGRPDGDARRAREPHAHMHMQHHTLTLCVGQPREPAILSMRIQDGGR